MGLAAPQLEAFAASFFSPARGLFFVAPWTLAAPVGALLLWRRDRSTAVALLACAVIYTFFVSSFRYWIASQAHPFPDKFGYGDPGDLVVEKPGVPGCV